MSLQEILENNKKTARKFNSSTTLVTEEQMDEHMDDLCDLLSLYRAYPDVFIDDMMDDNDKYESRLSQRLMLRLMLRYRYSYITCTRGFSKSFTNNIMNSVQTILYPNSKPAVSAGGKEQAASIISSKMTEIFNLLPFMKEEFDLERGSGSKDAADKVVYMGMAGSIYDNLPITETSRGQRRTSITAEEVIGVDQDKFLEIIIPTTNVNRMLGDGTTDGEEPINHSQRFITTAGYQNTYAYDKFLEILFGMLIEPDKNFCFGCGVDVAIMEDAIDEDLVNNNRVAMKKDAFDREYNSIWCAKNDNAFFNIEAFNKNRTIKKPEYTYDRNNVEAYYIMGMDVGRHKCNSEIMIIKVKPQKVGEAIKELVYNEALGDMDYPSQAVIIKRLFFQYNVRKICLDARTIGLPLIDELAINTHYDLETNKTYPRFNVYGSTGDDSYVKEMAKYDKSDTVHCIFAMKASAAINTEAYTYLSGQLNNGKLKFLIDETEARTTLMQTRKGKNMTTPEIEEYLKPYVQTSILRDQLNNLENQGQDMNVNLMIRQLTSNIPKDKVSALIYGLYLVKEEEKNGQHKTNKLSSLLMFG